jgi:hypothetical protein
MRRSLVRIVIATATLAAGVATSAAARGPAVAAGEDPGGTYVNGVRLTTESGQTSGVMSVDRDGGVHVFGHVDGQKGWSYYTERSGVTGFTTDADVYPSRDLVAMTPTPAGNAMDVVVSSCTTVKIFQVPSDLRTLPALQSEPTAFTGHCYSDEVTDRQPSAPAGIAGLQNGRIAVLFEGDPASKQATHKWTVYVGHPAGTFIRATFAGDVAKITSDPSGRYAYLEVANSPDFMDVYTFGGARAGWQRSAVTSLRRGSAAAKQLYGFSNSIAASHGQLFLSFPGRKADYIVRRDAAGKWLAPQALPVVLLAATPATPSPDIWAVTDRRPKITLSHFLDAKGWGDSFPLDVPDPAAGPGQTVYSLDAVSVDWQGNPYVEYEVNFYPRS